MRNITGEQIKAIGDEDLRELIRRLCVAEMRRLGLPESAVTAGGNQTAPDGGVDVHVDLPRGTSAAFDFVPRHLTGFQSKASDLARSGIVAEMHTERDGPLKPSIVELVEAGGAYIIVSSKGSVANGPLADRKAAMREQVQHLGGFTERCVDFYDRDRVAGWVDRYPGVAQWLRARLGIPLDGWQGIANWSNAPRSSPIRDDGRARFASRSDREPSGLTLSEGISEMRDALRTPGRVARLVGLSGTGKTRVAQALFEAFPDGSPPLDDSIVLYTDAAQAPQPAPISLIRQLGYDAKRAIVIVDNCDTAFHGQLASAIAQSSDHVSLLTIEHDVADDQPTSTDVFRLNACSDTVVEDLLLDQHPAMALGNRRAISHFAGGNARIALALASTLHSSDNIARLSSRELLVRLVQQRQPHDEVLLRVAGACALVYSFRNAIGGESVSSEVKQLAQVAHCTEIEAFDRIATLEARNLVQRRGDSCALLPHALANMLAIDALARTPTNVIVAAFASIPRLFGSFIHRLSYLHESPRAVGLAREWLAPGGRFGSVAGLDGVNRVIVSHLATLSPESMLQVLERTAAEPPPDFDLWQLPASRDWVRLLRQMAYTPELFSRAALLLLRCLEAQAVSGPIGGSEWLGLFQVSLSGTMATPEERATFLRTTSAAASPAELQWIGAAVGRTLATTVTGDIATPFGGRARGSGWHPDSDVQRLSWYRTAADLVRFGNSAGIAVLRRRVRRGLALELRNLWRVPSLRTIFDPVVREFAQNTGWAQGLVHLRLLLRYDREPGRVDEAGIRSARDLAALCEPQTLEERIRYAVINEVHPNTAEDEATPSTARPDRAYIEQLGGAAAGNDAALFEVLDELVTANGLQTIEFGRGMAMQSTRPEFHWSLVSASFLNNRVQGASLALLIGYLRGRHQVAPAEVDSLLDALVTDATFGPFVAILQTNAWNAAAAERLKRVMATGSVSATQCPIGYLDVGEGGWPIEAYCELVRRLSAMPDGAPQALWHVHDQIVKLQALPRAIPTELVTLTHELLTNYDFSAPDATLGDALAELIDATVTIPADAIVLDSVIARLSEAINISEWSARDYGSLVSHLFARYPTEALGGLLDPQRTERLQPMASVFEGSDVRPLESAPWEAVLAWAHADLTLRPPLVASEISILAAGENGASLTTKARDILGVALDKPAVLAAFEQEMLRWPRWSVDHEEAMRPTLQVLDALIAEADPLVSAWAVGVRVAVREAIARRSAVRLEVEVDFE